MGRLIKDTCETARAIMAGELDADLDYIMQACSARTKGMWRKGMTVRLTGTKNPTLDGKEGVILKVNTKTITIGVGVATTDQWGTSYDGGEYNVPPSMLTTKPKLEVV